MVKLTKETILEEYEYIKPYILPTPIIKSRISTDTKSVYLKLENFHRTASFKERGALSNLLRIKEYGNYGNGVIVASAGNHAQAVAYHAHQLGIKCTVVMPTITPNVKIENTKSFGANVIIHGSTLSESLKFAIEMGKTEGMIFLHPYDDEYTILGQSTVAVELLGQLEQLAEVGTADYVIVPVGGGGLISGISSYIKAVNPDIRIIAVESENCPSLTCSMKSGQPVSVHQAPSIADGIAVKQIGTLNYDIIKDHVDEVLTVSEENIEKALFNLLATDKILVEGSGAVAFAAVYLNLVDLINTDKRDHINIICICSGGNIDMSVLKNIFDKAL